MVSLGQVSFLGLGVTLPLLLAGCGTGAGETGFWQFTRASEASMPERCEELFGTTSQIGDGLGVTPTGLNEAADGTCTYDTATGGELQLIVAKKKPANAAVTVHGEVYWVGMNVYPTVPSDKQQQAVDWLTERANAVYDDYETWVQELPALAKGWTEPSTGFSTPADSNNVKTIDATMTTPAGSVSVISTEQPAYVTVDGEDHRAVEGERLYVFSLEVLRNEDLSSYRVEVDNVNSKKATAALVSDTETGHATLGISVPEDTKNVTLAATTGDTTQRISLLTGKIDDDGLSDQLATARSGLTDAVITEPDTRDADGEVTTWNGYIVAPYAKQCEWELTTWDQGVAPDNQAFLKVRLAPDETTNARALTAADADAAVNGQKYPATNWDPKSYTYTFLVPAKTDRITVTMKATLNPAKGRWSGDTGTYSGPQIYSWDIDTYDTLEDHEDD